MVNLMNTFFIMSVKGCIVLALIILIKAVFKNKLSASFHYYIWIILIIRLAIPWRVESSFSVFNIFNPIVQQKINYDNSKLKSTELHNLVNKDKVKKVNLKRNESKIGLKNILAYAWIAGILALSIYTLSGIIRVKSIERSSDSKEIPEFDRELSDCIRIVQIRKSITLKYTNKISSPCIYGIINPVIFIPSNLVKNISKSDFKYIIIHELCHLKRKDIIVKWIVTILNIIYWFNPIIRYGFYKMSQDCEISCDELAIKWLDNGENLKYGSTIIKILENQCSGDKLIGTTSMLENNSGIKKRILMISKCKGEVTMKKLIFGIFVIIIMAGIGLTNGISKTKADSISKISMNNASKYGASTLSMFDDDSSHKEFQMKEIRYIGYEEYYSDLFKENTYNVEFKNFSALEKYELKSSAAVYNMKINSKVKKGNVNIKIYDGEKVIFNESNPVNKSVKIQNKANKSLKLQFTGVVAEGNFKIDFVKA